MEFFYFLGAALLTEVIGVIAGFGASTLLMPISVFFMPIKQAILWVAIFHLFGVSSQMILFRRFPNWRVVLYFGIPAVFFTVVGAFLTSTLPADIVRKALGWFLVIWAGFSFFDERFRMPPKPAMLSIAGIGSGFVAGLIGTGGSIRASALTSFGLARESYIATSAVIATAVDLTRIPIYLAEGIADIRAGTVAALLITAIVATLIGRKIVFKIPKAVFTKVVIAAVFLAGLRFILE